MNVEIMDRKEDQQQAQTVAFISYLWIPGWLLALVLHGNKKTYLGGFHLRQALGIWMVSLFFPFVRFARWAILGIVMAMWLYGIVTAAKREQKPIPIMGDIFQRLFKGL
jgi:uncharacterized membrane protein